MVDIPPHATVVVISLLPKRQQEKEKRGAAAAGKHPTEYEIQQETPANGGPVCCVSEFIELRGPSVRPFLLRAEIQRKRKRKEKETSKLYH